jgi:2-succinyl-6-hydroxy-2,4-cyclohexadiene-1-carboxylate synthase
LPKKNGIVALHGFTGRGSDFAPLQALTAGSVDWLCPDLPGHGPDPQMDAGPEATIEGIHQVAEDNPTHRILLGYSMGGRAALHHALSNPDYWEALILIGANPGIYDPLERSQRREEDAILAKRIEADGIEAFMAHWQEQPIIASQSAIKPQWRTAMQEARKEHSAIGLANSLRQFGQGSIPNLWPKLRALHCPVLLITGGEDYKYTTISEKMLPLLPNGVHQILEKAGHMAHIEAPEAATTAIEDFLQTVA